MEGPLKEKGVEREVERSEGKLASLPIPPKCSAVGMLPIHGILQAGVLEWGATAFSVAFLRCQLMIVANEIHK